MSTLWLYLAVLLPLLAWRLSNRRRADNVLIDVAGPPKDHWLTGNFGRLFIDGWTYNLSLVEKYGGAVKIHGLLNSEQLYVSDPVALQTVVVKEQHVFEETDMFLMGNRLLFGEGLGATLGEQHKKQRKMVNPVFSLANMRNLLPAIQPIAKSVCAILLEQLKPDNEPTEINVLPWMTRCSLEHISQAAFGHSFGALDPSKSDEYVDAVTTLSPTAQKIILLRPLIPFLIRNFSLYWRNKVVDWAPIQPLRDLREKVRVMDSTSRKIFAEKKAAVAQSEEGTGDGFKGKDIMSIMLQANASSEGADTLSDDELLGQMNTIMFGGFETTALAISRVLYIVAREPDVQARLRTEVRKAKKAYLEHNGDESVGTKWEDVMLPYEELVNLPYLDAVLRETLRVYPPTTLLNRVTREDTSLPLLRPVQNSSGRQVTSIPLRKNTTVIISILAANHNKDVWGEDASVWRPERWLSTSAEGKDNGATVSDGSGEYSGQSKTNTKYPGVFSNMMTFLGGGRACIGFKFVEMEIKQLISTFVSEMHFSLPSGQSNKEVYWKMKGLLHPVIRPPAGDGETQQLPLCIRRVRDNDFL